LSFSCCGTRAHGEGGRNAEPERSAELRATRSISRLSESRCSLALHSGANSSSGWLLRSFNMAVSSRSVFASRARRSAWSFILRDHPELEDSWSSAAEIEKRREIG
jgi:hypothetical protein